MINTRQTANSDSGELYRTDDGGLSWTKLTSPAGGAIFFANENDGWEENGPIRSTLFVTHDGGATWTDEFPNGHPLREAALYDLPVKLADGSLILPMLGPDGDSLTVSRSTDGGATWLYLSGGSPLGGHGELRPYVFPDGRVVAVLSDGDRGLILTAGAPEFLAFNVKGLSSATAIDFANNAEGWALVNQSGCRSFKSDCWSVSYIEQTDDGGYNWSPR